MAITQEELNALLKQIKKEEIGNDPLFKYHKFNKNDAPYDIIDSRIAEDIKEQYSIAVISSIPYIYETGVYRCDKRGSRLKKIISKYIYPEIVKVNYIDRVYKFLIIDSDLEKEVDEMNQYPKHYINFKDGMLNVKEWKLFPHDTKYLCLNQIPHKVPLEEPKQKETMTTFINDVVPDRDDREMLRQYIGYCMTMDTTIQRFLILQGKGGTGKSAIIRLITKAIGQENISNLSLDNLNQRFYPTNLLGKLLNACSDIPKTALETTAGIKQIVGEDAVMGEIKGGEVFTFNSYAKLVFSANEIPISLDEKSNAFYRRLLIIKIDKRGREIEDLEDKLEAEIDYFIYRSLKSLQEMYKNRTILESENSKANVLELYKNADTVTAFITDRLVVDSRLKENREPLYRSYEDYCNESDRTALTRNGFYKNLRNKGYTELASNGVRYFKGMGYKEKEWQQLDTEPIQFPLNS